jgi:hypothetical protein
MGTSGSNPSSSTGESTTNRAAPALSCQALRPGIKFPNEHSFGFRPGRSAHHAVAQAQAYVIEGYQFVLDGRVPLRLQPLQDRLLDHAINHGSNAEVARPALPKNRFDLQLAVMRPA